MAAVIEGLIEAATRLVIPHQLAHLTQNRANRKLIRLIARDHLRTLLEAGWKTMTTELQAAVYVQSNDAGRF